MAEKGFVWNLGHIFGLMSFQPIVCFGLLRFLPSDFQPFTEKIYFYNRLQRLTKVLTSLFLFFYDVKIQSKIMQQEPLNLYIADHF